MSDFIQLNPKDNVAVALKDLPEGAGVDGVVLKQGVPRGHKVALEAVPEGGTLRRYGYPIGRATRTITPGEHVHTHNVASGLRDDEQYEYQPVASPAAPAAPPGPVTFEGFRRADGRVGIRNEIWILNTVGCVNRSSERIAQQAHREFAGTGSAIDGVYAFSHPYGCSQFGEGLDLTQKALAGLVRHPNAAAVLILGLGCENNQMELLLEKVGAFDRQRVRFFNAQDVEDEVEAGMKVMARLAEYAGQFRREPIPAAELILGMKCGGSDGLSGITANPLVGRISDRLTALGGTALLTEVSEMFGAERILMSRSTDERVFQDTVRMINDFKAYYHRHDCEIYENPSPGNQAGGITTLEEKSLGCILKGGQGQVNAVVPYGAPAQPRSGGIGLVFSPSNDGVSITSLTCAGSHMVLFTTGRGTPLGAPVPTLKIATNTPLAERKPGWIDFNAGALADGTATMDQLADDLFRLVLDVASGRRLAKNEINDHRIRSR